MSQELQFDLVKGAYSWRYLAGLFDGEGHVCLRLGSGRAASIVMLAQSGPPGEKLLTEIRAWLAGQQIPCQIGANKNGRRQVAYQLRITGRERQRNFLSSILPFLRVKKTVAQDLLRYFALFPPLRKGKAGAILARERCLEHGIVKNFKGPNIWGRRGRPHAG